MIPKAEAPFLIALNLTQRCNLACDHCYLDAKILKDGATTELTTDEIKSVLDDIAALSPECMVVLTGGEPLLRRDIEDLAAHASAQGLMVVVGSNGLLLTAERVETLKHAGVAGIGISLDSLVPEKHDAFRGRKGAWDKTMASIDACVAGGLPFQLHFSVTDDTADEIDDMVAFARDAGAMVLNVFFLVCTGRGEKYTDISPEKYEQVLRRVAHAARNEKRLMVRAKCAPHFKRIAMEIDPDWPITSAHGYDAGGCIAATRYARITPEGDVTPCPYMDTSVGSIRDTSFAEIWHDAPMLRAMRAPKLEGRCGVCEYQKLCGGCRARPLARDGNLMGEDYLCTYQPTGGAVIHPLGQRSAALDWTDEAETRIARVPGFVRRMVRQRAEEYVRGEGRAQVTADDLALLAKRRFGDAGPPSFPQPDRIGSGPPAGWSDE
jgi:radical SAM protein with 4Fe4S-binding SPASM domain